MSGSYEPDYWKLKNQRLVYWLCIVKFKERTVFANFPKDILGILTQLVQNQPTVESGDFCRVRETAWEFNGSYWVSGTRMRSACRLCNRPNLYCRVGFEGHHLCPKHIPNYFQFPVKFIE